MMRTFFRSLIAVPTVSLLAAGALGVALHSTATAKPAKPPGPPAGAVQPIAAKELGDFVEKFNTEDLQNRALGSPGEAEARKYIAGQMSEARLRPPGAVEAAAPPAPPSAAPPAPAPPSAPAPPPAAGAEAAAPPAADPSAFLQPLTLTLVKTRLLPGGAPQWKSTAATVPVQAKTAINDVVLLAGDTKSVTLTDAPVVFVGYGLTAPEFQWDDYKDGDLQDKVVLILDGDPQSDPKIFAGKARTHYARWPEKFAQAAKHGAAAALIVLDPDAAPPVASSLAMLRTAYGNQIEYALDRDPAAPDSPLKVRGFITEETVRRVIQSARIEYDDLRKFAEGRDFRPVRPKLHVSTSITVSSRTSEAANVVGMVLGSDPALQKEAVVYTAHFDGQSPLDSASGVATLLTIARAAQKRGPSPRTLVFAAVTAQNEDLLGARQLLAHLPAPVTKVIAHINLDGINPLGVEPSVIQIGRGHSTLDDILDAAAREKKRKVVPEPNPEFGLYYRSESLAFAKAGIPSLFLGWPDLTRYLREEYRQGKESRGAAWSFAGGAEDAELLLTVGRRLAQAKVAPTFKKTDPFAPKK